jgi:hypothetical protein
MYGATITSEFEDLSNMSLCCDLMRWFLKIAMCLIICESVANSQTDPQITRERNHSIKRFLREYLSAKRIEPDTSTRVAIAAMDADAGGANRQFVAYLSGNGFCGSGGCTMYVLTPVGNTYTVIGRSTLVWLPVRALTSVSHGRCDLAVWVQGGGIQPGHEVILQFDGKKYQSNPTIPPAKSARGVAAGRVLIPKDVIAEVLYE